MSGEFEPGKAVQLNSRVRRITAPNPGVMTGPGTNTYLLGSDEVAVLDEAHRILLDFAVIHDECMCGGKDNEIVSPTELGLIHGDNQVVISIEHGVATVSLFSTPGNDSELTRRYQQTLL